MVALDCLRREWYGEGFKKDYKTMQNELSWKKIQIETNYVKESFYLYSGYQSKRPGK